MGNKNIDLRGAPFSYFRAPAANVTPYKNPCTLEILHGLIKGEKYKTATARLRAATTSQYKELKKTVLDYVTFGGCFSYRNKDSITSISGLMIFDFDHIEDPEKYKDFLSQEPGALMMFTSPGGGGLKVVFANPMTEDSYSEQYAVMAEHFKNRYRLTADATSDIVRACFLCHDPNVWYAPDHTQPALLEQLTEALGCESHDETLTAVPWDDLQEKPLFLPRMEVKHFRANGWRHPPTQTAEDYQNCVKNFKRKKKKEVKR